MGRTVHKNRPPQDIKALARLVDELMEKEKLSTYEVSRRALEAGPEYRIEHSTVWNIRRGSVTYILPATISALARGLDIGVKQIEDILNGISGEVEVRLSERTLTLSDEMWSILDTESKRCRRDFNAHIEALLLASIGEDVNIETKRLRLVAQQKEAANQKEVEPAPAPARKRKAR
jgi:plasmid maintenance system antidote protein VapI